MTATADWQPMYAIDGHAQYFECGRARVGASSADELEVEIYESDGSSQIARVPRTVIDAAFEARKKLTEMGVL